MKSLVLTVAIIVFLLPDLATAESPEAIGRPVVTNALLKQYEPGLDLETCLKELKLAAVDLNPMKNPTVGKSHGSIEFDLPEGRLIISTETVPGTPRMVLARPPFLLTGP